MPLARKKTPSPDGWRLDLRELIADEMAVTAHCSNPRCNYRHVLDLKALAEKFGPDTPAMAADLVPRLKCTRCDGKDISLTYTPQPAVRASSSNPYLRAKGGR